MKKGNQTSNVIKLTESELYALVKESVIEILESTGKHNFKSHDNKIMAAMHAAKLSRDEMRNQWSDIMAKRAAITDINKYIADNETGHNKERFHGQIKPETFDINFSDLDLGGTYYDSLHEEYWPGDVNPRVLQTVQQDSIKNQVNDCYQRIDDCLEEIRRFAKSGNAGQVMYYAEQIETCAKLINRFKPEIK
jgi:hypothetical protein